MRPNALLLGYLEGTVVYFWFLLLGLSGNIISSLPEDNKGLNDDYKGYKEVATQEDFDKF